VACARPRVTLLTAVLLAAACLVYTIDTLTFATSTRALMPRNVPFIERYGQLDKEFGDLDDLVIVVEAPSLPEATVYANRLVREVKAAQVPLTRLSYRIDPKQFEGRALLYLSVDKLKEIRNRIFDYQDFMEAFAARPTLDQLVDGVATQIAHAFVGGFLDLGLSDSKGSLDLKFVHDLVAQIGNRLDRPGPYRSPWGALFSVGGDSAGAGYFLSDDQRLLFILAAPEETTSGTFTSNRGAIEGVRDVVTRLKREFPDVNVGVTGKPALANDEMAAAFRDSQRATVLAFALTLALMLIAFLRIGKPIVMLMLLALGLCWSIGVATLVIGHLSLFSVMFISIVIGIGIDYGIYFLFRYEEELFLGRNLKEAIEITAARTGPGVLVGAITAAATFYVLILTDFRGLQELGFIAGTAILLEWIAMFTVFPAALVIMDRRHAARPRGTVPRALALESIHVPLVDRLTSRPRLVLVLAAVLAVTSILALGSVRFDYNLLNLQAHGTESVVWEKKILATSGRSGFAAMSSADTLDELRAKHHAFRKLDTVSEVDSALLLIPDDQPEKQKIIADFAPIVAPVRVSRPLPVDPHRRGRADAAAAAGLPRLRLELPAAAEQPESAHGGARRRAARDQAQVHQRARPLPDPGPSGGQHLGPRRGQAFRGRAAERRSRRDRHAGHHLRGDPAHGARLQAGHAVRDRAGERADRADAAPRARDAAGAVPAGARARVDGRPDVHLQATVQPRQRLWPAADPRGRCGVRSGHRNPVHGRPRPRWSTRRALDDHGGAGRRTQHHHRVWQSSAGRPPRDLRTRPAAHRRHRRLSRRRAHRPARPPPPPPAPRDPSARTPRTANRDTSAVDPTRVDAPERCTGATRMGRCRRGPSGPPLTFKSNSGLLLAHASRLRPAEAGLAMPG
jgi:MMPL family